MTLLLIVAQTSQLGDNVVLHPSAVFLYNLQHTRRGIEASTRWKLRRKSSTQILLTSSLLLSTTVQRTDERPPEDVVQGDTRPEDGAAPEDLVPEDESPTATTSPEDPVESKDSPIDSLQHEHPAPDDPPPESASLQQIIETVAAVLQTLGQMSQIHDTLTAISQMSPAEFKQMAVLAESIVKYNVLFIAW